MISSDVAEDKACRNSDRSLLTTNCECRKLSSGRAWLCACAAGFGLSMPEKYGVELRKYWLDRKEDLFTTVPHPLANLVLRYHIDITTQLGFSCDLCSNLADRRINNNYV